MVMGSVSLGIFAERRGGVAVPASSQMIMCCAFPVRGAGAYIAAGGLDNPLILPPRTISANRNFTHSLPPKGGRDIHIW